MTERPRLFRRSLTLHDGTLRVRCPSGLQHHSNEESGRSTVHHFPSGLSHGGRICRLTTAASWNAAGREYATFCDLWSVARTQPSIPILSLYPPVDSGSDERNPLATLDPDPTVDRRTMLPWDASSRDTTDASARGLYIDLHGQMANLTLEGSLSNIREASLNPSETTVVDETVRAVIPPGTVLVSIPWEATLHVPVTEQSSSSSSSNSNATRKPNSSNSDVSNSNSMFRGSATGSAPVRLAVELLGTLQRGREVSSEEGERFKEVTGLEGGSAEEDRHCQPGRRKEKARGMEGGRERNEVGGYQRLPTDQLEQREREIAALWWTYATSLLPSHVEVR